MDTTTTTTRTIAGARNVLIVVQGARSVVAQFAATATRRRQLVVLGVFAQGVLDFFHRESTVVRLPVRELDTHGLAQALKLVR